MHAVEDGRTGKAGQPIPDTVLLSPQGWHQMGVVTIRKQLTQGQYDVGRRLSHAPDRLLEDVLVKAHVLVLPDR